MKKLISIPIIFLVILAQAIFVFPVQKVQAFNYVINDFNFYPTPNTPKPTKGVPYTDPVFNTKIVRITDGQTDFGGSRLNYPGFVRFDAESPDGTKLIMSSLQYPNDYILNALPPYNILGSIPTSITQDLDTDPRWDHSDSDIIYTTHDTKFYRYRISTGEITVLHDFKTDFPTLPIARVYAKEGANPSWDSRYWAWTVRCADATHDPTWWDAALIVYDKDYYGEDNGKVISTLLAGPLFSFGNFINISPKGNYVTIDVEGSGKYYVYPRDLSSRKEIPWNVNVHSFAGLGLDDEGREVAFWVEQYGSLGYWVVMADLETGTKYYLAPFGTVPNFNASGMMFLKPGWAVMSTIQYDATNWSDGEILIYELSKRITNPTMDNHTKVWRVAHTHSKYTAHVDEPFAKPNKKGTKIFFRSNWGVDYAAGGMLDTYQINLPESWESDLSNTTPDITPPAAPSGVSVN